MRLNKEIQAFYPCYQVEPNDYMKVKYELLTTIVYAQVKIDSEGIILEKGYDPINLIRYAHDRKVKVVLMFQIKDTSSADIIIANQNNEIETVINNLINEVETKNFDGIDIDLEGINEINSINCQSNKQLMTDFITRLSNFFWNSNPNYRISMDIGLYYPDADKIFDIKILKDKINYLMIMGYDCYGNWSSVAGPNSPIILDLGSAAKSIIESIRHYEMFIDKKKLLLGVPWYGYEFSTVSDERLAVRNGIVTSFPYKDKIDLIDSYSRKWDSLWKTPWYTRKEHSQWYQGHYDDVKSLRVKYDLVKLEGLAGIGIWAINHGIDRPELWQLIQNKFTFHRKIK